MDVLSHGLWGGAIVASKGKRFFWLGFLFGILPDIISFLPHFFDMTFGDGWHPLGKRPPLESIPQITFALYNVTHSLIIFSAAFLATWAFLKKPFLPTLAWGLHILLDIPTHSTSFFPTPFLWPISDFKIDGISWSHPLIYFTNLGLLFLIYMYLLFLRPRRLAKKEEGIPVAEENSSEKILS